MRDGADEQIAAAARVVNRGAIRTGKGSRAVAGCIALISILFTACSGEELDRPPSRLTTGIVIYEDVFFGGAAAHVTRDVSSLRGYASPCIETHDSGDDPNFSMGSRTWSHCMSSVRVAPGWKAVLYAGSRFTGAQFEVTSDIPDLREVPGSCEGSLNDCVSSIRVFPQ